MSFGQVVVGPPGSGKSTYCHGMQQFLTALGRPVALVNLDPANDAVPYRADVDVSELITLSDVMEQLSLGPNGGLIYCMEYVEANLDWLLAKLKPFEDRYVVLDLPGQIELFTHHKSVQNILHALQKAAFRLTCVHVVDVIHCSEPSQFVSVLLLSLCAQLHLEMPHVNVLSKVDLLTRLPPLPFGLEFYTDLMDLSRLLEHLNGDGDGDGTGDGARYSSDTRFHKLNAAVCDLVQDFGCTSFVPVAIEDKESVLHVLRVVDKANGYAYSGLDAVYAQQAVRGQQSRERAQQQQKLAAAAAAANRNNPQLAAAAAAAALSVGDARADELKRAAAHPLFNAVSMGADFEYFHAQAVSDRYAPAEVVTEHDGNEAVGATKRAPLSAQPPATAATAPPSTAAAAAAVSASPATAPAPSASHAAAAAAAARKPGAAVGSSALRSCARCGRRETRAAEFRRCGQCRALHYCSPDCQKADWATHKLTCTPAPAPAAPAKAKPSSQ